VSLDLTKINQDQVLHVIYNLAPKTFLFITSQRRLLHGSRRYKDHVEKVVENLKAQELAIRQKRSSEVTSDKVARNAAAVQEESKDRLNLSDSQMHLVLNQSHTID